MHEPRCLGVESYITGQLATGEAFLGIDHQANGQKPLGQRHRGLLVRVASLDGAGQHVETGLATMAIPAPDALALLLAPYPLTTAMGTVGAAGPSASPPGTGYRLADRENAG